MTELYYLILKTGTDGFSLSLNHRTGLDEVSYRTTTIFPRMVTTYIAVPQFSRLVIWGLFHNQLKANIISLAFCNSSFLFDSGLLLVIRLLVVILEVLRAFYQIMFYKSNIIFNRETIIGY